MKTIKANIITLVLFVFFSPFCQSQNIQYRSKIRPIVKTKFDSLYPHASDIILNQSQISDTTQILEFNCNCQETNDMIVLIFDTNGNVLNKEVHYNSIKDLPDTIVHYMKKNTSSHIRFFNNYMIEYINNKGEISYGIVMLESPNAWSQSQYILRFKNSGELISKEGPIEGGQ